MADLVDFETIGENQRVELREGGMLYLAQLAMIEGEEVLVAGMELDATAATRLFDFLLLHMDRLTRRRDSGGEVPGGAG